MLRGFLYAVVFTPCSVTFAVHWVHQMDMKYTTTGPSYTYYTQMAYAVQFQTPRAVFLRRGLGGR